MKVNNTRKQKAAELLRTLEQGPHLDCGRDDADRQVRTWLETWIIPRVKELVPELRHLFRHTER